MHQGQSERWGGGGFILFCTMWSFTCKASTPASAGHFPISIASGAVTELAPRPHEPRLARAKSHIVDGATFRQTMVCGKEHP
jgi:hypothetical protein